MEIVYKKVNDLIPYINNSRTHSEEQVNQIVASINEFGFTNPLLIDEKDNIIAGHGRLLASKKLKMEEVPCIVLSGLTEAQKKAYIIADNKMALNAGWDEELLKVELENLKELDFDLELTGFNVDELDDIFQVEEEQQIVEDDFDIEPPEEPKAKLGDIYQLENHRLMCGDSTSEEDVSKLVGEQKMDLLITDPPYNVDYTGKTKEAMKIQNDKMENNVFHDFLVKAFSNAYNFLKDGGAFYWQKSGINRKRRIKMIEKVNPSHPDKVADRIAGENTDLDWEIVKQDKHLAENQSKEIRCGDNGIFKGVPLTSNEILISKIARDIYNKFSTDGKYILTDNKFIICQSNATTEELKQFALTNRECIINPLGEWTGGTDVDSGATNRKLGSDMAQSVTGGGLHGKDLSKADVSVNIYAFLKAQETEKTVELCCAIGDNTIDGKPYAEIVEIARNYINKIGGFEKFAEWGLY